MNTKSALVAAVAGLVLVYLIAGCDSEPAGSPLTINPTSATVHKGESVTFTVEGGYEYVWSIDNAAYGVLSNTRGSSTTYTSIYESSTNNIVYQTLRVQSYIPGDSVGSTNSSSQSASASIIHN